MIYLAKLRELGLDSKKAERVMRVLYASPLSGVDMRITGKFVPVRCYEDTEAIAFLEGKMHIDGVREFMEVLR